MNESFARHFFGNTDVLGRTFSFIDSGKRLDTIVGVVADALDRGIKERARSVAYSAYSQDPLGQVTLAVRTQQEPKAVAGEVLSAIRSIDPQVPVESTTTAEAQMNESLQRERMLAQLTSGLGSLAGLVATLGLYGLLAYSVVRRTREIAIRMALGSSLNGVRWMLVREGAVLVSAGVAIGCPLYFALAHVIRRRCSRCARLTRRNEHGPVRAVPPSVRSRSTSQSHAQHGSIRLRRLSTNDR